MNAFSNLPEELRVLKNWVLWKYVAVEGKKPTKVPYQINGYKANVTDASNWSTFNDCFNSLSLGGYDGIGFVFTNTPYSGIDLDDPNGDDLILQRQIKIFQEFDSYSELSPSGKGLHIIVKGNVPSGRRKSSIEVYSTNRYFTVTGNIYNGNAIIAERQNVLTLLWEQMGETVSPQIVIPDKLEEYTDEEIVKRATEAVNGEKFLKLYKGEWREVFPSIPLDQGPSEADFALVDIIAFYTQNREQIARIFCKSILGKRDKIKRKDYLPNMIQRSFDRQPQPIDFDGMKEALNNKLDSVAQRSELAAHNGLVVGSSPTAITIPPGLLGEIASFIYNQAPRPVPEIALAGAIGLLAGVVGRAYNINGTGLNQYVLVLAKTGRGKEAAALGIDKIMNAIKFTVPTSSSFRGPGDINSGQALIKYLNHTSKCFVSVIGEFGITIDKISHPYANSADKMLYKLLLDLYNKSGHGQTMQASIYSKKEDSVGITEAPSVTILGESTHKLFYKVLTEEMISAGLLPRFLIIDYGGERVANNENAHLVQPSFTLVEKFASLVAHCETIMAGNNIVNVKCDDEAAKLLRRFDKSSDIKINSAKDDVVAELWNRAHMKVMRLSALIAVGVNNVEPLVIVDYVNWAISLVETDIKLLSTRFENGEIGTNTHEIKQAEEVIRIIKDYFTFDYDKVKKYTNDKSDKMHKDKVIPYVYLNRRLSAVSIFRLDKAGATTSLKRAIQNLIDTDRIKELSKVWASEKYGTPQRCFVVADLTILD